MEQKMFDDVKEVIKNLCLMNNKFMNKMLDGNIEAAQIMLRVILKNDKIVVKDVRIQNFIQNLYGHSAQLDILAQDENGRYFNVEVQRSDEGAPPKRARFYNSVLDTYFLKSGKNYEELPDCYVIFITENDVLDNKLPLYNISRTIKENNKDFGDGANIVYVNSKYQDDTPLGRLMQDFYCTDPGKLHYREFGQRMEFLKYTKEGEEKMTDIIELYAENKARKAAEAAEYKQKIEIAENLLTEGMSIEFIARNANLSLEEVRKLAEKNSA